MEIGLGLLLGGSTLIISYLIGLFLMIKAFVYGVEYKTFKRMLISYSIGITTSLIILAIVIFFIWLQKYKIHI